MCMRAESKGSEAFEESDRWLSMQTLLKADFNQQN